MSALRTSDVIARVVAWHNRHPLARRIAAADVHSVGVVALPFALPEPPGDDPALTPIFGGDWIYAADPGPLGAWVRRHGRYPLPECADWPHRQVDADLSRAHAADAAGLEGRTLRHVLTAVVERDGQRVRVLLAPHAPLTRAAVFGTRLASPRRAAAFAGPALAAGAAALVAVAWLRPAAVPPAAPAVIPPALAAASAARPPSPAPAASAVLQVASAPAEAASEPAAAHEHVAAEHLAAASAPARPTDVHPMLYLREDGAPPLVQIRPRLTDEEQRDARVQAAQLRPPAAVSAASAAGTVYAIATLPLRTRDDALAQQALLQGLKAQVPTPVPTELALMPAQGRWRVVWFPHPLQREAEDLVVQARARGLRVELIAF